MVFRQCYVLNICNKYMLCVKPFLYLTMFINRCYDIDHDSWSNKFYCLPERGLC